MLDMMLLDSLSFILNPKLLQFPRIISRALILFKAPSNSLSAPAGCSLLISCTSDRTGEFKF